MDDSGYSFGLDFDPSTIDITSFITEDLLQMSPPDMETLTFYELRSKPVPLSESPSFKTEAVKSRTQMKQQLMKDQLLKEQERRRKVEQVQQRNEPEISRATNANVKVPIKINDVPQHVLHVKTGLQNPTRYHIQEKKRNQVLQFLSSSQKDEADFGLGQVHSAPVLQSKVLPNARVSSSFTVPQPSPSPGMQSIASGNTSDAEDVLEGILSYEESSLASEVDGSRRSLYGSQASLDKSYSSLTGNPVKYEAYSPCYEDSTKDRVKKETHNQIERRRRYNINDRIKELGDLLPQRNEPYYDVVRDSRTSKGNVLKSSVDFIKVLKHDNNKMKLLEQDNRQLLAQNRQLLLRIQQLELASQAKGVELKERTWKPVQPEQIINQFIRTSNRSQMPDVVTEAASVYDESMDDVVLPDPVLSSAMVSLPTMPQNQMDTD